MNREAVEKMERTRQANRELTEKLHNVKALTEAGMKLPDALKESGLTLFEYSQNANRLL